MDEAHFFFLPLGHKILYLTHAMGFQGKGEPIFLLTAENVSQLSVFKSTPAS